MLNDTVPKWKHYDADKADTNEVGMEMGGADTTGG